MHWVRIYLGVLFHPIEAFRRLKFYRDSLNYLPIVIVMFAVMVVRISAIYLFHFPMVTLNPQNTNLFLELLKFIVPIVSWGIVSFAVTSIWDGECFMKECMATATVAVVPYVVFGIPVALLTKIMDDSQSGFLSVINTAIVVWIVFLLFVGLMTMNDFGFKHSLQVYLVSAVGMLLLWSVFLLLATLTYQLINFVNGVLIEIRLRSGV